MGKVEMFLDGPDAKTRDAVHVIFAGEKVHDEYVEPVPEIENLEQYKNSKTLPLKDLVRMKLTSHRLKDRVHILDMISVGLIDETWLAPLHPELQQRLQRLLDNPDG